MLSPVPQFTRALKALSSILTKAEAHCVAKKIDPSVFVTARLFPDMLPFSTQIGITCDHAKGAAARLSGREVPSFNDPMTSFAELQTRIAQTMAFIATVPDGEFADADGRSISLKVGGTDMTFPGAAYLAGFALPNFYFHMTTAYNILRMSGVELGKRDFIGAP